MFIQILRPQCSANTYCHKTNNCPVSCTDMYQETCSASDVYCGFDATCTPSTLASTCSSFNRYATLDGNLKYQVLSVYPHTVAATGYGSVTLDTTIDDIPVRIPLVHLKKQTSSVWQAYR